MKDSYQLCVVTSFVPSLLLEKSRRGLGTRLCGNTTDLRLDEGHVACTNSCTFFHSIIRYHGDLPVHRHLKFSHVLGQTSVKSSNTIRPATNRDRLEIEGRIPNHVIHDT